MDILVDGTGRSFFGNAACIRRTGAGLGTRSRIGGKVHYRSGLRSIANLVRGARRICDDGLVRHGLEVESQESNGSRGDGFDDNGNRNYFFGQDGCGAACSRIVIGSIAGAQIDLSEYIEAGGLYHRYWVLSFTARNFDLLTNDLATLIINLVNVNFPSSNLGDWE